MPQAVAWVAAQVAMVAFQLGTAAGLSVATAATIANLAYVATTVAVVVGVTAGAMALAMPQLPKPGSVQTPLKQSRAPRRSAFGTVRAGGIYALYEAVDKMSVDVTALLDGRSNAFVGYYLNDDPVTLQLDATVVPEDGRKYGPGLAWMYTRLGAASETAYAEVSAVFPDWTSDHRGDGVTSLALICKQAKDKHQQEDFPNGVPVPSALLEAQRVYDPRDEAQVQGDPATYVYSANPALCLMAYMTDACGGMGLSYDRYFAPTIDYWTAAADDCDADEATEAGTEPRYRCHGTYLHDNAPGDIQKAILSSFDGFLAPRGDGALVVRSGRYYAPTVTIGDQHVLSYALQHFLPDEQAINVFVVGFTDPEADYQTGDAGEIEDEPDILARGKRRSQSLELDWVQSRSQAVRLAKRALTRSTQPLRGTVTTNMFGMNALGERYLRLQISDNAALEDLVVEVSGRIELDLASLTIKIPWIAADETIDDGDPGAETPLPGPPPPRPLPTPLVAPTIDDITPLYENASSSDTGARLSIDVTAPVEDGVEWLFRWRVDGATFWHEGESSDVDDGAAITLVTGFVTVNDVLEVQVAYRTAGGVSPWSATFPVSVDAPADDFEDAVDAAGGRDLIASEDLASGDLVNLHTVTGAVRMRKADADDTSKPAHGFVRAAVATAATGKFYGPGRTNNALSGLTPGATYWLSTAAGGVAGAAPSGAGNSNQEVGQALSATELLFAPLKPVEAP
jgi:hypothetical protein